MHEGQIIDLVSRLRRRAHEIIAAELVRRGHAGVAPSHGAILSMLYGRGGLPMSALAKGAGLRKNTVTAHVRKLEEAGYVRRGADPLDNRVTLVSLTPKGDAFRADFTAVSDALLARIWGGMQGERRAELVQGLEELLRNLG